MARRRKNEGLLDLLVELPWWVTLILGLIFMGVSGGGSNALVALVFKMFAYACFLAAFVGGIKSLVRNSLFASANDIEAIRAMSWREFETLVGEAYRRQGYMVEEAGGGGADGGIDLVLRGKGQKILVQCKRWQKVQVDVMIVREMFGLLHHEKADRVIIVTIGTYTPDATDFARGKPIDLVNGKALVQMICAVKGEPIAAPAATSAQSVQTASQKIQVATSNAAAPACPKCGATMVIRTARQGANAGNTFWGCPKYPACRGTVSV